MIATATTSRRSTRPARCRAAAWCVPALAILVAGVPAVAQPAPTPPAPAAATGDKAGKGKGKEAPKDSLPEMGEVFSAIDKATTPKPDDASPGWSAPVRLAVVFGALALLPSLLIMTTSFTRIVIVLAFVRRALTTQNIPPTIAIIGLALFLTIFTMSATLGQIHTQAVVPFTNNEISFEQSVDRGSALLKEFMLQHTRRTDLKLFLDLSETAPPKTQADVPLRVAVPAFAISEFRTAFEMGCLLFIPFLLIDLVVAGILLSAGMMMLPPAIISLPFKIILFVLVDGWGMLARQLVMSFR